MKNNHKIFSLLFPFLYIFFALLSIHTINNIYFYILSFVSIFYFLYKKYLKLSLSIFVITILLIPIWLLFNNFLYSHLLHYTLFSDVLIALVIPLIFSFINSSKKHKIEFIYIFIPILILSFYKYFAYDNLIYWLSIILIAISALNIFEINYVKVQNKKAEVIILLLYVFTISLFLIDMFKIQNTNRIAVLKSGWCDVSNNPNKMSHEINYYYAYSDFVNILKSYGNVEVITNQDINQGLTKYNVVILITPTTPIDSTQVLKLTNFVTSGGRLILITDHTNLYGHIDSIEGLLHSFGVRMNDDAVFNPNNYYEKAILNTNSLKLNNIIMKTGNSIIPPVTSKIWAITPKIISEKADYTKENFFGDLLFTPDDSVGNFITGATIRKGLGSFVIWNDSTLFSNFAITQKDNIKLLDYIIKNKIYNSDNRKTVYKFINIFSKDSKIFWEAPPNHTPDAKHFSTLIANFSRNNLFPDYSNSHSDKTIFFTDYNYLKNNINKINSSKIVLIDDVPDNNFLQVKKYSFDNYKITNSFDNFYYSKDGRHVNVKYKNKDIVLAKNVLSDNELGTWWNITPISPYKKEMITNFFAWLKNNSDKIEIFKYPDLYCKNQSYFVKADNNNEEYLNNICISKTIKSDNNAIIYLGNRKWAFVVDSNTYFGNPELSDNYANTLNIKWTAKRVFKKMQAKEVVHKGCPLNRFQVGTKYVAP